MLEEGIKRGCGFVIRAGEAIPFRRIGGRDTTDGRAFLLRSADFGATDEKTFAFCAEIRYDRGYPGLDKEASLCYHITTLS